MENPYDYNAHIQLIQSANDPEERKQYYQQMSLYFPLSPDLWLDWIGLEPESTIALCTKALDDYLSIPIYQKLLNEMIETGDFDSDLFESSLERTKHHFTESHLIWNIYRDLLLNQLENGQTTREFVNEQFLDRLRVQHQEIDATFYDYYRFESDETLLRQAQEIVDHTKKQQMKREQYESKIQQDPSLVQYEQYLEFESTHPERCLVLFERALVPYCLEPTLWESYLLCLVSSNKDPLPVVKRAVRNCPYSPNLWSVYEQGFGFLASLGDAKQLNPFLIQYLSLLVKRAAEDETKYQAVREWFDATLQVVRELPTRDPEATFNRAMAQMEYRIFVDQEKAKALYETMLKPFFYLSEAWLEYIEMCDPEEQRVLYQRATSKRLDQHQKLFYKWHEMEALHGTVESQLQARAKWTKYQKKHLQSEPVVEKREGQVLEPVEAKKPKIHKKLDPSEYKIIPNSNAGCMIYLCPLDSRIDQDKLQQAFQVFGRIIDIILQPNEESGELEAFIEYTEPIVDHGPVAIGELQLTPIRCKPNEHLWKFKTTRQENVLFVSQLSSQINKQDLRLAFAKFGKIKEIRLNIRGKNAFAYIEVQQVDPKKLIVTNLPFAMLEHDIQEHFHVRNINLVMDKRGKFNGTAFLHYETEEEAQKYLLLNGTQIQGRTVVVSIADPNKRQNKKEAAVQHKLNKREQKSKPVGQPKTQDDFRSLFYGTAKQ
ncbi:hypothetical protein EDD86DRAFT_265959 [Gorgonomyces haynaldii]|nr:hypothetical protein EDD86DRAFT_265959 [Gorgonomyces haynaldii]